MQKNDRLGAAPHCLVAELRAPLQCTRDLKNGNTTRLPPKRTHPNRSATKDRAAKARLLPQRRNERHSCGSTFSLAWRIGASLMQRRSHKTQRWQGKRQRNLTSSDRKRPRVRRSSSKNAKSMRFNVPTYGIWVLSDYITAGKQPACFHCSTLARTKAHTFGTFRHLDPNSTGCLDPEARNRPDHSDSIASGWPQRGNICPQATPPIG